MLVYPKHKTKHKTKTNRPLPKQNKTCKHSCFFAATNAAKRTTTRCCNKTVKHKKKNKRNINVGKKMARDSRLLGSCQGVFARITPNLFLSYLTYLSNYHNSSSLNYWTVSKLINNPSLGDNSSLNCHYCQDVQINNPCLGIPNFIEKRRDSFFFVFFFIKKKRVCSTVNLSHYNSSH